jgi:sterol desaturase/sphingolipid hydroxylase (fatty acid hydroxylase superfamily)
MTWGPKHIVGVLSMTKSGDAEVRKNYFGCKKSPLGDWGTLGDYIYACVLGAHLGHLLDFSVALLCYYLLYSDGTWVEEAKTWQVNWVSRFMFFNLVCLLLPAFWHWFVYKTSARSQALQAVKMVQQNQYEPDGGNVGMFFSSTGQLEREITYSTLGWLQSGAWQCIFTYLWASGFLPFYSDFWLYPATSILIMFGVTFWREIHFYHAHRMMHPWFDKDRGLFDGDIGAFLYRYAHSLHHKSHNPGPWSGLCMHPIEHFLYYTCATLMPLVLTLHPMHFLYCKFHADIAPIGGHDGYQDPGPNGDYHLLHHMKFECNYGVPWPVNFDKFWGTWVEPAEYRKTGVARANGEWANTQMHEEKTAPLLNAEDKQTEATMEMIPMDVVKQHTSPSDCWIVLYCRVFDVTGFLESHPGGKAILLKKAGTDATAQFEQIHSGSGGYALVDKMTPAPRFVGAVEDYTGPAPPDAGASGGKECGMPGIFFSMLCLAAALTGTLWPASS